MLSQRTDESVIIELWCRLTAVFDQKNHKKIFKSVALQRF
jgi:hypothetical protein